MLGYRFSTALRQLGSKLLRTGAPVRFSVQDSSLLLKRPWTGTLRTSRDKVIGYWLLGCSGMVVGAVVLGGVTRLTESGLSITEWQPIKGVRPPMSNVEWICEFEKYQNSPEFKYKNQDINLSEFKWIWYMEYAHRLWGRAIGVAIAVPAAYFWIRGWLTPSMKKKVLAFVGLVGFQGFLGWHMVKSGLEEKQNQYEIPRVSQYRLCAHLGSALVLFSGLFWEGLSHVYVLKQRSIVSIHPHIRIIRHLAHGSVAAIFLTALSGAFVAGLDAGLVYNSWPKMADRWIPSDVLSMKPMWRNMFENHSTTQFQHRVLGYITASVVTALWLYSRKKLPPRAQLAANMMLAAVGIQVGLGVATLLTYVPTHIAASHQGNSVALLSLGLWLMHELRRIPKI